jgi:hypothetical protein
MSLTLRRVSAAHADAVEGHQNGAIEGSRGGIDELSDLFRTENGGQAVALFGIGSVRYAPGLLECLDVEEAQGAQMVGHATGRQLLHREELGLVLPNVLPTLGGPERSGSVVRIFRRSGCSVVCGSLRVMTSLEFLQHDFS